MTSQSSETILILGAGLTGLAAAYFLAQQGHRATLVDCPSWQDGFQSHPSDAAPMLFGRHRETWRLLAMINGNTAGQLETALPLEFALPDGQVVAYRSAHLPGALQWMMSLFSFHGLAWHDRWTLFSHLEQIWEQSRTLPADLENRVADEWLTSIGQSQHACERIWAPLAHWLTGNALARLSAATFVRLLSTIFLGQAVDARLTQVTGTMGERFITPMRSVLQQRGVQFRPQPHPPVLRFGQNGISGVQLRDGSILEAQSYISALSHQKLLALLPENLLTRYAYFAHLSELETLPEIAVRFTYRTGIQHPRLLLLAGRPFQHLTITALRPYEISCRLSAIGNPALMEVPNDQLLELGYRELQALVPEIEHGERLSGEICRDDQAALALQPGSALLRPIQQSPIKNLLVAGAWTDTGWSANVESAVVSARRCMDIIAGHPI
ncbi:MAG: FAD-dependent oxidoreductase [Nitrospiraceae bacterium]